MSVSKIQVDSIQSFDPPNSAVILPQGATVPSGKTISGAGDINVNGTLTSTTFVGNGDGITGVNFATVSKTIAFSLLAG
jgi:hypothetical protein